MLSKIVLFVMGVLFCSLSLSFIVLYINMINLGYSFFEFVNFIIRRWECYLFVVGVILIIFSFKKGKQSI